MTEDASEQTDNPAVRVLNEVTSGVDDELSAREQARIAKSFFLLCQATLFSKLGDIISNPKITLSWLMQSIGAPAFAISLIVPLREAGSMIPQIFLADTVNRYGKQVRLYQAGLILQAVSMLVIAAIALYLEAALAGWLIVLMVAVFSLARCLCSLVSKSILGKLIPKTLRGQVTGWSSTAAGLASCFVAAWLLLQSDDRSLGGSLILLLLACSAWFVSVAVYQFVSAHESTEDGQSKTENRDGTHSFMQIIDRQLEPFRQDSDFALFVGSRALLLGSALVAPYYVLLGSQLSSSSISVLAGLLIASGSAQLVSSVVWGRWADQSSRRTLATAGFLVFLTGVLTCTLYWLNAEWFASFWVISGLYFLLEISYQGVRIARKTYVVDLATDETRVDYVAASNSVIGVILLTAGAVMGLASSILSPVYIIALLSFACLLGAWLAARLREVQ